MDGPLISPSMLQSSDGENINGPSLIRVPEWVSKPLGRYYLYFAHHRGKYIRMAYANDLAGPWSVLPGGVLNLTDTPAVIDHIASPDVVIDHLTKQIRMYFHGRSISEPSAQRSFVALSSNGITFIPSDAILGNFYFRVFRHGECWYAISKGGLLHRSRDGLSPFEVGKCTHPKDRTVRHVAVISSLSNWPYFTRIGDRPERILRGWVDLTSKWTSWVMRSLQEVIRPELPFEGSTLPLKESKSGAAKHPENALRDPAIFVDSDAKVYLLYSTRGEQGIAIAEVMD